jgi:hypothetical protein
MSGAEAVGAKFLNFGIFGRECFWWQIVKDIF